MEELYKSNNSSQNNTLANNLNSYSDESIQLSSIKKNNTTFQKSTIDVIKKFVGHIIIPYSNEDEIRLIKIKDPNYLETGENIGIYIANLDKFDDDKFNICKICREEENKYFCKNCNNNICEFCSKICLSKYHNLFDLQEKLKEIENYKKKIREYLKLIKNNQNCDNIEKIDI